MVIKEAIARGKSNYELVVQHSTNEINQKISLELGKMLVNMIGNKMIDGIGHLLKTFNWYRNDRRYIAININL